MRNAPSLLVLAACLAAPTAAFAQEEPHDPWEGFNRSMFAVHETVDKAVVEPVARGYRAITLRPVRTGVQNFLRNLRGPVVFANDVLQGEFGRAGVTAARFGLNTTIGVAGVLDPASGMGLERHDEDFGQTLAVWGVDSGPYVFIPLLGPSTVRDAFGRVVDRGLDPLTYAEGEDADEFRAGQTVFTVLSTREQLLDPIASVRANSVDPYAALRASYLQLRESAIQNGRTNIQDLPEFDATPVTPEDGETNDDEGTQSNLLSTGVTLETPALEQDAGGKP
ncbi:MAG: VacJ family lipoprotein [Hyphomonadaceae bacterium]|nr:VacJ family lipoprotein [Hyphomonadaceae bacterium]